MCNKQKRPRLDSRVHGQLKPLKRNKSREDDLCKRVLTETNDLKNLNFTQTDIPVN